MKNNSLFKVTILSALVGSAVVSCDVMKDVEYSVTPNPLEMHGDTVRIRIEGTFPEKGLGKKVTAKFTPKIGDVELKPIEFKGEKDKYEHASSEEELKEIEDDTEGSEKDNEETEGFDAGFAFKTHVKGILTLVDKMMKTESIDRETVILIRRCKKTLDDIRYYEEAVLEDRVEKAMDNAHRTFKRLVSF